MSSKRYNMLNELCSTNMMLASSDNNVGTALSIISVNF